MNGTFFRLAATLVSGLVFGFGLSLSGMLDPARVRAFLDITGNWNPSLAFVLGGAVFVSALGVRLARRLKRPLFDETFHMPDNQVIDRRLIVGAATFGVGWGLVGLCPGPALASLSLGLPATMLFVAAMAVGMLIHDRLVARKPSRTGGATEAGARLSQPH